MTSFTGHWDGPKNLFTHNVPLSSGKGTGSDKEDSLEPFWNICNTELLESVLVTAIAINSSRTTSCRVGYSAAVIPGDDVPLVRNIPGITRKTTTRTAKVTAAADRLASLQHSLLMLLHLLTYSLPDTNMRCAEKVAAQVGTKDISLQCSSERTH